MDNNEYVKFHVKRKIVNLYKDFLDLVEDLSGRQYNIGKEDYQKIRKRVLDKGNNAIRELETEIDKFEIKLKNHEDISN